MLQVVPCLALHDTMRHIGSSVATVGFGGCMGMSGFMLAVGAKVYSSTASTCHPQADAICALFRLICSSAHAFFSYGCASAIALLLLYVHPLSWTFLAIRCLCITCPALAKRSGHHAWVCMHLLPVALKCSWLSWVPYSTQAKAHDAFCSLTQRLVI